MRIIKPGWLIHGGEKRDFEIYSCNVSPDGKRLATAAGDGHVRIWSTEAIVKADDPYYDSPRQLCSLTTHTGTIHTVRFSPNGKYLASGADDKFVCVYTLDTTSAPLTATFGSSEAPPSENWRIHRRLMGHDSDVQDLGWSHDSSILVSVGLDSKIVVWSGFTFERLKTISSHLSHVKGICFDPANKYFCTASDDRTVRIFRFTSPTATSSSHDQYQNFMLEQTISDPFKKSPITTYFRRCSWSPQGGHIAAANAFNGPVPSIAIIERGSWDSTFSLIGHESPCEVCAFCPVEFENHNDPSAPGVSIVACAGQDKTLSLWKTANPKPLFVSYELAAKSITDIGWSPSGHSIYITSLDGSITCFELTEEELGRPISAQVTEMELSKYGGRRGGGIVDSAESLRLEEAGRQAERSALDSRMNRLLGAAQENEKSQSNGTSLQTNGVHDSPSSPKEPAPPAQEPPSSADAIAAKKQEELAKLKRRVTVTKDGKRRVAPLLLGSSGNSTSTLPQTASVGSGGPGTTNPQQGVLDLSNPFDAMPKGGLRSLLLGNRQKLSAAEGERADRNEAKLAAAGKNGAIPILTVSEGGSTPARVLAPEEGQKSPPEYLRPAVVNPSLTVSQTRLAVPKVPSQILRSLGLRGAIQDEPQQSGTGNSRTIFQAINSAQPVATGRSGDKEPTRLALVRGGTTLWQDYLPRSVLLITGNDNFWMVACEDGSLYAWSPNGRRLLCPLVMESQPVILECMGWWVLCISATGLCHVWNFQDLSSPHPPASLAPVLDAALHPLHPNPTRGPAIQAARLTSEGRIVISMSNGDGFSYSPKMYSWQRLSEGWWMGGSQYWNSTNANISDLASTHKHVTDYDGKDDTPRALDVSAGIIPELERRTTQECLLRGRAHYLQRLVKLLESREGFEAMETTVSIAHLENRMAGAIELGARDEFRAYLYMYAKAIGSLGKRSKVQELLGLLQGSMFEKDDAETHFGGWPRKDLLRDVVLIFGRQRDLQKLVTPYASLLGLGEVSAAAPTRGVEGAGVEDDDDEKML